MRHLVRLLLLATAGAGWLGAIDRETARFMEQATVKFFCPMSDGYATGSGFVVGDSHYVATNFHVAGGRRCFVVLGANRRVTYEVVAESREEDLLIAKLPVDSGRKPVTRFSSHTTVSKLERVFALGFPGVADTSALDLEVKATSGVISASAHIKGRTLYQTDATIHHGNSGGPLFDECGNLVGINDMITENAPGFNYAIQADRLVPLLRTAGMTISEASECNLQAAPAPPAGADWITRGLLVLAIAMGAAGIVLGTSRRGREAVKTGVHRLTASRRAMAPPGLRQPPPQAQPQYPYPQPQAAPAPQPAAAARQVTLRGLAGQYARTDVPLNDGVITLGRDPRYCQVVFNDAPNVSKRHCSLRYDSRAGTVLLEDLGSTNGTFTGAGERLMPGQARPLRPRDRFWMGDQSTMFEVF